MSKFVNGVGFGAAFRWARAAFVKNTLSFIALSVVVMILQFGQQFAATPFTETLSLCVEAGGTGETIDSTAVSSCFESEMGQLLIVTLMAVVFVIASFLATAGVVRGALYVTLGRRIASYLMSGLFWGIPTLLFLPLAALVTAYVYRSLQGETVDPAA